MTDTSIYADIARRTGGDVYIGVVGPVRTGKSTLIKRFAEALLIPGMTHEFARERARDEMPQSASGKTVMTTEPKFIPEEAVEVSLGDNATVKLKLIDCVGYVVPGAMGLTEEGQPRMVLTPWSADPLPFEEAAELGTRKVIADHSTVGIVVTTDGSITELPRESYVEAEKQVASELKALKKPFVMVLNSARPRSQKTTELARELHESYGVPVLPLNCLELSDGDLRDILASLLYEFPVREIKVAMPAWIDRLDDDDELKSAVYDSLSETVSSVARVGDIAVAAGAFSACGNVTSSLRGINLGEGSAVIDIRVPDCLFYDALSKKSGFEIDGEQGLMELLCSLSTVKREYDRVKTAIEEVRETGYGIVTPDASELTLEEPEIVKQPGGYGVRLKASAPSIHVACSKPKFQ